VSRRSVLAALALAAVIALSTSVASAEYRGTDLWSNLTPGEGTGGLADRYPLSHYQLDYYVDNVGVGLNGVDTSSVFPGLAHFFASMIFFAGATLMRLVIYVFDWAFNADLLTGGSGLLAPLSAVVKDNYDEVVLPFVVPAVIALGAWLSYKAVHREHKDVGPVLVRTLVFFTLSFVVAFPPSRDDRSRLHDGRPAVEVGRQQRWRCTERLRQPLHDLRLPSVGGAGVRGPAGVHR
jgi:hypothetical protein